MKKTIALLVVILMLAGAAVADVDLASMTYDELLTLRSQLDAEILNRPEWKSVTVPAGEWKVGVDIPAGAYAIYPVGSSVVIHLWGAAIDDFRTNGGMRISDLMEKEGYGRIILYDGNVLQLGGAVIMTPAVGLGF